MSGKLRLTGKLEIVARKMLKDLCRILDKSKIPYALDAGTLLGIIRENRLLPWDNDLDIAITDDYLDKLISVNWKIWLAGYKIRIRKSIKDMPHFPAGSVRLISVEKTRFFHRSISLLDVFVKKKVDENLFWTEGIKTPVLKSVPYRFYKNLSRIVFDGYNYSIPKEYEDYLTIRYGDWKTPVKEYNFKKDDKAIVK